jgi:hypothetical protein
MIDINWGHVHHVGSVMATRVYCTLLSSVPFHEKPCGLYILCHILIMLSHSDPGPPLIYRGYVGLTSPCYQLRVSVSKSFSIPQKELFLFSQKNDFWTTTWSLAFSICFIVNPRYSNATF